MDEHLLRLPNFIFMVGTTDADRHYVTIVRPQQDHLVEYSDSLMSEHSA
jgi:hypothetical protein